MTDQAKLTEVLVECLNGDSDIPISPASLAACAMTKMDPHGEAPIKVSLGCNLQMRQLARTLLRKEYDGVQEVNEDQELFEKLQDRYPAKRDGENYYVPRMQLTYEERMVNVARMAKEVEAKQAHHDALLSETNHLMATGFFDKQA